MKVMSWMYLVLGLWVAASPWLANAFGVSLGASSVVAGSLIALLALWNKFGQSKN